MISKITSNEWKSDTLIVHGTLTNTSSSSVSLMTPALIGYDGKNQEVDAGRIVLANPELKGGQTEAFTAEISDPRKSIKFTKLVGIRSRYYVATRPAYVVAATPEVTTTPYATASPALALFRNPYSRANFRPFFAICVFGQRFWRDTHFCNPRNNRGLWSQVPSETGIFDPGAETHGGCISAGKACEWWVSHRQDAQRSWRYT